MGLDISISRVENVRCPECGAFIETKEIECESSGGRVWYDILECFGYYVPYEERTPDNDWYGKDMKLTSEQAEELYRFVRGREIYNKELILDVIAVAKMEGHDVVINANW